MDDYEHKIKTLNDEYNQKMSELSKVRNLFTRISTYEKEYSDIESRILESKKVEEEIEKEIVAKRKKYADILMKLSDANKTYAEMMDNIAMISSQSDGSEPSEMDN
ncbi:hypothetical protein GPJ56_009175 [Histomonas meleagridis]|uniref:uncharacterized protein n=1 Tax=Histomonas meleagridis TaxID=135588 RepID=UPI00355A08E8|nr:hypothetical protein GPJ56_009175 [Histomonas meleagridis]KAH0799071.1 hypothetical protein GO595_007868 [Histomonas meleagridis]